MDLSVTQKGPHGCSESRLDRSNGSVRRHEVYVKGSYGRSSVQLRYLQLPAEARILRAYNPEIPWVVASMRLYDAPPLSDTCGSNPAAACGTFSCVAWLRLNSEV